MWNLKQCSNPKCGLIWLDPMPVKEDMGQAYANYYTHAPQAARSHLQFIKQIYKLMKRGFLAGRYGYRINSTSCFVRCIGKILYVFPLQRCDVDAGVRFLHAVPEGRLLDVGCGSGEWLASMRELGWNVCGVDFDEGAVSLARQSGLDIRCGDLEAQRFPDESFDAVTLNHVIEHVPDPVRTLLECARILKRNGKLVIFTPNSSSLGHRIFRQHWRGLEPPRHLHLFSPLSMKAVLNLAGFSDTSVRTINSSYVWQHSLRLWVGRHGRTGGILSRLTTTLLSTVFTLIEQILLVSSPNAGECVAVRAQKNRERVVDSNNPTDPGTV